MIRLFCLLWVVVPAFATDTQVELILDASGSMYNKIEDGRYRIVAAKEALRAFVDGLPDKDVNVGLRVYGAKVKAGGEGACTDSVLEVPVSGCDKQRLNEVIERTKALGATPIAWSLDQAIEDFQPEGKRLIVLVTDGKEACNGDLAAAAAKLKAAGIELRIIGFDLDSDAAKSFADVARFENTRNVRELASALGRAVSETLPPPKPLTEATLKAPDEIGAGSAFEVYFEAQVGDRDFVTIVPEGEREDVYGNWAYTSSGNPARLIAPGTPGTYELRYQSDRVAGVAARRTIKVVEASAVLTVPKSAPAGSKFEVSWQGPNNPRDYVTIVKPDAPADHYEAYQYTSNGQKLKLQAPMEPGPYEVRYLSENTVGTIYGRVPIEIVPGEVVLDFPGTVKVGSTFDISWVGPDGDGDYLTIVKPDAAVGEYGAWRYTRDGNVLAIQAPDQPGTYEVRYQSERVNVIFARLPLKVE